MKNNRFKQLIALVMLWTTSLQLSTISGQYAGTRIVNEFGNENCIELSNATTRVVLEPNLGGRVLIYEVNGKNVLWINDKNEGKPYVEGEAYGHPGAGRFDYGPEKTGNKSNTLFYSKWKAEIIGPRNARMISETDPVSGLSLERRFKLDNEGSHLECIQLMKNESEITVRTYHWSRTFVKGGGISLTPLNPNSRYPLGFLLYGTGSVMEYKPKSEPNIRTRDGVLEIIGPPSKSKFVMDCDQGWLAYITTDDQLFIKKYKIYPDRHYWDLAAPTASIYYYKDQMCEVEPLGPLEILEPGEVASFTEHWYLYDYEYPENRRADLDEIQRKVKRSL